MLPFTRNYRKISNFSGVCENYWHVRERLHANVDISYFRECFRHFRNKFCRKIHIFVSTLFNVHMIFGIDFICEYQSPIVGLQSITSAHPASIKHEERILFLVWLSYNPPPTFCTILYCPQAPYQFYERMRNAKLLNSRGNWEGGGTIKKRGQTTYSKQFYLMGLVQNPKCKLDLARFRYSSYTRSSSVFPSLLYTVLSGGQTNFFLKSANRKSSSSWAHSAIANQQIS